MTDFECKKEGQCEESEAQKKATRKYIAGQYRPSIYIDKELQIDIWNNFDR